jgi:hypothetical protein
MAISYAQFYSEEWNVGYREVTKTGAHPKGRLLTCRSKFEKKKRFCGNDGIKRFTLLSAEIRS